MADRERTVDAARNGHAGQVPHTNGDARAVAGPRGVLALLQTLARSRWEFAGGDGRASAPEERLVHPRIARRLARFAAGMLVAAVGLTLALAGAAVLFSRLAGAEPWLALFLVGSVTLVGGAIFAKRAIGRAAHADLAVSATLAELGTDMESARCAPDPGSDRAR